MLISWPAGASLERGLRRRRFIEIALAHYRAMRRPTRGAAK